jgi:hypothetical protein
LALQSTLSINQIKDMADTAELFLINKEFVNLVICLGSDTFWKKLVKDRLELIDTDSPLMMSISS